MNGMGGLLHYPFSLWQKLLERRLRASGRGGAALMLHDVYAAGEQPREPEIAISAGNFAALLDGLEKRGRLVPLRDYDDVLRMEAGCAALTFDDMFRSAYLNAVPLLRERGIPYTVFAAAGLIGRPGYITEDDLTDLAADPLCALGAHSVTHRMFRFCPELLRKEAEQSGKALGARLFAYPYGSIYACSRRNRRDVEESGLYACAFSTLNAELTEEAKKMRFFLPRVNVNDTVCRKWLEGGEEGIR